jgi:hypothetical protein
MSVAVIGSFRHYFTEVAVAAEAFLEAGVHVLSPSVTAVHRPNIINPGAEFVRFDIDPQSSSDAELQEVTNRRILAADFVFVVAPGGYVGRTTCYELGQAALAGIPVFFSEDVRDLPICVPASAIRDAAQLAQDIARHGQEVIMSKGYKAARV